MNDQYISSNQAINPIAAQQSDPWVKKMAATWDNNNTRPLTGPETIFHSKEWLRNMDTNARRMPDNFQRTQRYKDSTLDGTALGTVVGGGLGALWKKNRLLGTYVGGMLGGVTGFGYDKSHHRMRTYNKKEFLDEVIGPEISHNIGQEIRAGLWSKQVAQTAKEIREGS